MTDINYIGTIAYIRNIPKNVGFHQNETKQNDEEEVCVYIRFIRKIIGRQTATRIHEQKA